MKKILKKASVVCLLVAFVLAMIPPAPATANPVPIRVIVNGRVVQFPDQLPIIVDNRVLVPVGGVFQEMGFQTSWDDVTRIARLTRSDFTIIIPAGATSFVANNVIIQPDVPQRMVNHRLMLPLRAIADAVGGTAIWDAPNRTAHITVPVPPEVTPTPSPSPTPDPSPSPSPSPSPTPAPTASPVPLLTAAPQFEGSPSTFAIGGIAYMQGIRYTDAIWGVLGATGWSRHNLNRQFGSLYITIGRLDNSGDAIRNVRFIGDNNRVLGTFAVQGPVFAPMHVRVDVSDVSILRIEIDDPGNSGANIVLANAILHPPAPHTPGPTPSPTPTPSPVPFLTAAPQFEGAPGFATGGNAYMLGIRHPNSIWGINVPGTGGWSHHNLGGRFSTITATIGRFDGSGTEARYIRFIADNNRELATVRVEGNDFIPLQIQLDVRGVSILRIQIDDPQTNGVVVVLGNIMIH